MQQLTHGIQSLIRHLGFKYAYIIVKEFAYFTEVFPHAGPTVGAVLLHLSMEMNRFHAFSTIKDELLPKHYCSL